MSQVNQNIVSQFLNVSVYQYATTINNIESYDLKMYQLSENKAIKAGIKGLHVTVNGMGERAGNAPLESTVAVINDFLPEIKIDIRSCRI